AADDVLERADHLPLAAARPRAFDQGVHEVPVGGCRVLEIREALLDRGAVAAGPRRLEAADLLALEGGVDSEDLDRLLIDKLVPVHAHDEPPLLIHLRLVTPGGVGDLTLGEVALDRFDHATEVLDL